MTIALDALDTKAASVYDGYLVRKDLVRRYARQYPVPTYVVEFLLGRYCASTNEKEIAEGLEIVEKQLKDRTVRTGDQEIFKARARDTGHPLFASSACFAKWLSSIPATRPSVSRSMRSIVGP